MLEFIERAEFIHGNKYDYSLTNYMGAKNKIIIICPTHGKFSQTPSKHLYGQGCAKCVGLTKTTSELITELKLIHGDKYDYSLVNYENVEKKIMIICKKHGIFRQTSDIHLRGCGCPKCGNENKKNQSSTKEEFIKKAMAVHGNKYNYSLVEYVNAKTCVSIICEKHGKFLQKPDGHTQGKGCRFCNESKGEKKIEEYLILHGIEYVREKTFDKFKKLKKFYSFDFYLPTTNKLIEYDGVQHFKPIKYWGGDIEFKARQATDEIKNNFATTNNIKLIRIKYDEINKIEEILKNTL